MIGLRGHGTGRTRRSNVCHCQPINLGQSAAAAVRAWPVTVWRCVRQTFEVVSIGPHCTLCKTGNIKMTIIVVVVMVLISVYCVCFVQTKYIIFAVKCSVVMQCYPASLTLLVCTYHFNIMPHCMICLVLLWLCCAQSIYFAIHLSLKIWNETASLKL